MILGNRMIKFGMCTVEFDEISTIRLENDDGEVVQLDPTDLSILYNSYVGMLRELAEAEKEKKCQK